jgi:hypothetical protein
MIKAITKATLLSAVAVASLMGGTTPTTTMGNLMWEDTREVKEKTYNYESAKQHCQNLNLSSHSDWRVPTIQELFSIVDYTTRRPAIKQEFGNTDKSGAYWSSTPMKLRVATDKPENWVVDFYKGRVTTQETAKADVYLRCVRDMGGSVSTSTPTPAPKATQSAGISYKDIKVGMNKNNLPSQIKLVKGSKMREYDKSFMYKDGNKNKISINGRDYTVSFVIAGNGTVTSVTYTANNAMNVTDSELKRLGSTLSNQTLKRRTMNSYTNGKLSNIVYEHKHMKGGTEYDFRIIYGNGNASYGKNQIMVMDSMRDKAKSTAETDKMMKKTVNNMFIKVPKSSYVCFDLASYKQLIDNVSSGIKTTPRQCVFTDSEISFYKTNVKEYYRGKTILKMLGNKGQSLWVLDAFVK